jgi:thiosulfate/3-mercaptopyruvate sulfurtransferase
MPLLVAGSARGTGVDIPVMEAIVSTQWLARHLGESDLRVLDASWRVLHPVSRAAAANGSSEPAQDPAVAFGRAHIPGAVFFDIEQIADPDSPLPLTLPPPEQFGRLVGALGIGDGDRLVVYGTDNLIASARVWWMFRVFGHDRVAVLDGGLPKWQAEGRALESETPAPICRQFTARFHADIVADLEQVRANLTSRRAQVLDARSAARFAGTEPEGRPGLRGGRIPGSLNLPYERLFRAEDGTLLAADALRQAFEVAGLDVQRPVITTCGAGISAAVLALGLHVLGNRTVAVYDGSWTEWGGRDDTPVERS